MKTLQTRDEHETAAAPNRCFSEWVPRHELAKLVPQIVKAARETPPMAAAVAANPTATEAEMTLAVLVYCYAIGICRSREIEHRVGRTQARGEMPARLRLDAAAFAQFRRLHAPLIKQCLASALFQAFRMQWNPGGLGGNMPPRLQRFDRQQASDLNALLLLESEAERRLEIAESWDRFDQEGWVGNAEGRK